MEGCTFDDTLKNMNLHYALSDTGKESIRQMFDKVKKEEEGK